MSGDLYADREKELSDAVMPLQNHVTLASPMSEERKYVRTSILPSLLESAAYNLARSIKDVPLFRDQRCI